MPRATGQGREAAASGMSTCASEKCAQLFSISDSMCRPVMINAVPPSQRCSSCSHAELSMERSTRVANSTPHNTEPVIAIKDPAVVEPLRARMQAALAKL